MHARTKTQARFVIPSKKKASKDDIFCRPDWLMRKRWPEIKEPQHKLRIADLFCGCGGLSLGAWEAAYRIGAKFEVGFAVDIEEPALQVYRNNFERFGQNIYATDIKEFFLNDLSAELSFEELRLKKLVKKLDVLLAGAPCQGHSDLNNSSRRNDPRNYLYLAPIRAAKVFNPKVIILENVPTVIHANEAVVSSATEELKKMGYQVIDHVVRLDGLGVPQTRKRHVLIAAKFDLCHVDAALKMLRPQNKPTLEAFLMDCADEPLTKSAAFYQPGKPTAENKARIDYLFNKNLYDLPNMLRPTCHKDKKHSYVSMYGRLRLDEPAQTITSGFGSMGQGRFIHPTKMRTLTPHEAARIQGFPDFFRFETCEKLTSLRHMIGNAVPPTLTSVILQLMHSHGALVLEK